MDQPSEHIKKYLILFVIAVIFIQYANTIGFFEPKSHRGRGYFVRFPEGWEMVKKKKGQRYPQDVEVLNIVPKGTDWTKGIPKAVISVYSKKLSTPIWIEDEWADILNGIQRAGSRILDKGQIEIDEKITHWVVYHDQKTPALVLKFYFVTDNNVYYNIEYSADPDVFNQLRPDFEEFKNSFKFRFLIL